MSIGQGLELMFAMVLCGAIAAITVAGVAALLCEQKVQLWEAVLLAGLAVSMLGIVVPIVGTPWYPVGVAGAIGLGAYVYWLALSDRRGGIKRLLKDDERRALAAIECDYSNLAAHAFLGDIYRKQGKYPDAIEQYEIALGLSTSVPGEAGELKRRIRATKRQAADMRRCPHCGESIPRRAAVCPYCEARMAWLGWIVPTDPEEARRFWTTVALSVLGFVAAGALHRIVGWWVWLALVVWVSLLVIAITKPDEMASRPQPGGTVDAVFEDDRDGP